MTLPHDLSVPDQFLKATETDWQQAADRALKGAPRERLNSQTDDGLAVLPLYGRRADVTPRQSRPAGLPWSVIQRIDHPDPAASNAQSLEDLTGGASGLEIVLASSTVSDGLGVRVDDLCCLESLFDGVYLDLIDLRLNAGHEGVATLALVMAYLDKHRIDPATVRISAGFDYLGWLADRGRHRLPIETLESRVRDAALAVQALGCPARIFEADGRVWHDAGAGQAEELAFVMTTALAYMRCMESSPRPIGDWADRISFTLLADADQIGTIAKARAARRLWAAILDGCGLPQRQMHLHMQTSYRMLTTRDPWVNMLRNTVATFAAGIGGADSICVLPHTKAIGLPDAFARRLARNTQTILLEESNLHKVADPSAGSGAIEARTEALTAAAWQILQAVEADGGMLAALMSGSIQSRITATRARRDKDVARRKRPITGVSEFPDLAEKPVLVLDTPLEDVSSFVELRDLPASGQGERFQAMVAALLDGAKLPEVMATPPRQTVAIKVAALSHGRTSQPFELLRAAADSNDATTGERPAVFLACLGPLAQFTARASWIRNAFAAGGIESRGGEPLDGDIGALVAAFRQSGARLACLVSSDNVYEAEAEAAARALKQAGADHLYLAGKPGALEPRLTAAGVDDFVYAGCDILAMLVAAHARLGLTGPDDLIATDPEALT